MSVKYGNNNSLFDLISSFVLILIIFTSIYFIPCGASNQSSYLNSYRSIFSDIRFPRLFKRETSSCTNTSECVNDLHGSVCVQSKCRCAQGYIPNQEGSYSCLQIGKHLGIFCNISAQCGEDLECRNHVCLCHEGFQFFQTQGINMCLLWHRPTRVDRCRITEDCTQHDSNTVCKKKWCQCNNGYQMFETMLFGRKQKCFKIHRIKCNTSSQCSKLAETPDQYCKCHYGFCHCMVDINSTALEIANWSSDRPNWYQRWKKDLILATRLLFITVILFFVPCFIYVTLGVGERSRQLFSQFVQPSRSPAVHYTQRRSSNLRSLRSYHGLADIGTTIQSPSEVHHVEISLQPNGINSRLIESRGRNYLQSNCENRDALHPRDSMDKEEDPPPSYDEIMRRDIYPEAPPPPYREL